MSMRELEKLLEQAVAEALGVEIPDREAGARRRIRTSYRRVRTS